MKPKHLAVLGAGWAGLAGAVRSVEAGCAVTVFEASRIPGGRARRVAHDEAALPFALDNGQHILIGAYREALALLRSVGVSPEQSLLRLPLTLRYPDGSGLALPDSPPPWDALAGMGRARGWTLGERFALLARATHWRTRGFSCDASATVSDLTAGLPRRLLQDFVTPLCVSALNTPPERASGAVFLRVLRDSLFAGRGGSNFLLPRRDLGSLFAEAAVSWLRQRGAAVQLGTRVLGVDARQGGGFGLRLAGNAESGVFDAVLLAFSAPHAAELYINPPRGAINFDSAAVHRWQAAAAALQHEGIATCYAWAPAAGGRPWSAPLLALRADHPLAPQFVFDRSWLAHGAPVPAQRRLLAFVTSACAAPREEVQAQTVHQAHTQLGLVIEPVMTVVEKRATFACTPRLARPPSAIAPGLAAAGDYVEGPYPATLEGAVMSAAPALAALGI